MEVHLHFHFHNGSESMAEKLPDDFEFDVVSRGRAPGEKRKEEYSKYLDGGLWKVDVSKDHGFHNEDKEHAENRFIASLRTWLKLNNHDFVIKHGRYQNQKGVKVIKLIPFVRPVDPNATNGEQNGEAPENQENANVGDPPAA